jgi:hypothetical protein
MFKLFKWIPVGLISDGAFRKNRTSKSRPNWPVPQ